jgi:4-hydroxybenzoate polyprenyltransferase
LDTIACELKESAVSAPSSAEGEDPSVPLVLDLDGTLLRTDLLAEMAVAFVVRRPWNLFRMVAWLLKGRVVLKRQLAEASDLDWNLLPVNDDVEAWAAAEARKGRTVYIATASDGIAARRITRRFPFVAEVIASDGRINLKGEKKAEELVARFPGGFDYAGDDWSDVPVWRHSRRAIVVEGKRSIQRVAARVAPIARSFTRKSLWRPFLTSLRLHQWAKNALVFVPVILSGRIYDTSALGATLLAFIGLGFVASATYFFNDLLDIAHDRRHRSKRHRPLASGQLPLATAGLAVPVGLGLGFALAALAGGKVVAVMGIYLLVTLAYSSGLKRVPMLDVFTLAALFTLRIVVGIASSGAPPSPWLLVFSMFIFGSLSLAKRHTEISALVKLEESEIGGRGYLAGDLPFVLAAGVSTGMAAVLIMVLYIIEDAFRQSFYGNTEWLWGFPAILFLFVSRIWLVCQRDTLHDDPVYFAIKDVPSIMLGGGLFICFILAWAGV